MAFELRVRWLISFTWNWPGNLQLAPEGCQAVRFVVLNTSWSLCLCTKALCCYPWVPLWFLVLVSTCMYQGRNGFHEKPPFGPWNSNCLNVLTPCNNPLYNYPHPSWLALSWLAVSSKGRFSSCIASNSKTLEGALLHLFSTFCIFLFHSLS